MKFKIRLSHWLIRETKPDSVQIVTFMIQGFLGVSVRLELTTRRMYEGFTKPKGHRVKKLSRRCTNGRTGKIKNT